jgi:hypothetical protein
MSVLREKAITYKDLFHSRLQAVTQLQVLQPALTRTVKAHIFLFPANQVPTGTPVLVESLRDIQNRQDLGYVSHQRSRFLGLELTTTRQTAQYSDGQRTGVFARTNVE